MRVLGAHREEPGDAQTWPRSTVGEEASIPSHPSPRYRNRWVSTREVAEVHRAAVVALPGSGEHVEHPAEVHGQVQRRPVLVCGAIEAEHGGVEARARRIRFLSIVAGTHVL